MCLLGTQTLCGQDSTIFQVLYDGLRTDTSYRLPVDEISNFADSIVNELHYDQYLAANVDSIQGIYTDYAIHIHRGTQYQDIFITPNATAIEYAQGRLKPKSYPYKDALALKASLLTAADDLGFSFAEIKFENIKVEEDKVSAEMHLELNRKVLVNELKIIGDAKVSAGFIGPYLGLSRGKPLSKKQLKLTQRRLDNLPFISSNKNPNVVYSDQGADVYVFAKERQASRFDAILGVLPVNDPLLDRSVILTASAMVDLINTLQRGERIFLEFRQLKPLTQDVHAEVRLPYFAGLPFGLRSSFELAKQDTSFLDVDYTVGAQYLYGGDNFIEVFFASDVTRLLNINEASIISSRDLPERIDTRIQYYGVQSQYQNLDNRINPREGWLIKSKLMIGVKELRKNSLILDLVDPVDAAFDFETLYNGFEKQNQFILSFDASRYFPIGKQSALKVDLRGAGIFSEGAVFDNERYRIGGSQLLRGFNEQSFFTDRYLLNTFEYRFTLTGNSVLFAFSDQAILQPDKSEKKSLLPWGLGVGVNFDTAAGILSLSAATGRDLANPEDFFDIGKPRIHVGYVNLF